MSRHTHCRAKCALCARSILIRRTVRSGSRTQIMRLVRQLEDDLSLTENDREAQACILNGTWPSAVEQLEAALVLAREQRVREAEVL